MASYDIIIPHYGSGELTAVCRACLKAIHENSAGESYRIIFIDNGSPEFRDISRSLAVHDHLVVRNSINLGFVKATNQGLAISNAPYVVLLNNDAVVQPGWLPALRRGLETPARGRGVGISGPLSTAPGSWQGRWNVTGPAPYVLAPGRMLAFFCAMIDRRVLETPGLARLDESYGVGLGDDDAYCRLAQQAGWQLALVQDLRIQHAQRSTFRSLYSADELAQMQAAAMKRFRETA